MTSLHLESVILADRHHGLTEGVRGLLEAMFTAVVMVADEDSFYTSVERIQPDAAVVDLSLFRKGGLDWLARAKVVCPQMIVIILSVHDEPAVRRAVLAAGAHGCVVKRSIATDLLPAIETALLHRHGAGRGAA
ncbi:MAG: response regulator transcription factor [Verrucomicrobiota bacterium]